MVRERRGGLAHGTGTVSWFLYGAPNGRYEGMVVNGRMNGTGTAFYPSGNRYVGEFRDGIPDGRGHTYWPTAVKSPGIGRPVAGARMTRRFECR